MYPLCSCTIQNWTPGRVRKGVGGRGELFLPKFCDYSYTRMSTLNECISSGILLVSKAGVPHVDFLPPKGRALRRNVKALSCSSFFCLNSSRFDTKLCLIVFLWQYMLSPFPWGWKELMRRNSICELCSHQPREVWYLLEGVLNCACTLERSDDFNYSL